MSEQPVPSPAEASGPAEVSVPHVLGADDRAESPGARADRNWNDILQEVRVTQTSTQILGGFLLAVAFQPRFTGLDTYQLALYLVLVALVGLATALGLTIVMLHRRYFGKHQKGRVVHIGNRLLLLHLGVVAVLVAGVTGLIFDFVLSRAAGLTALLIALLLGLLVALVIWLRVPGGSAQRNS